MSDKHVPGEGLLHPVPLISIGVLLVNDHILKWVYPGFLTGKLSDFAGLTFFPLLLQALWELLQKLFRGSFSPSQRALWVCALLTASVFAWIKLTTLGGEVYTRGLYLMQWPFISLSRGALMPLYGKVKMIQDETDLIALPCVLVALWAGRNRLGL